MDDDESPPEQPPFRWNSQAVFMLFFFMFAMAIPLMGVVWFARGYLSAQQQAAPQPTPAVKAEINMEPLRAALENVANTQLGDAVKLETETTITIRTGDVPPRASRIAELAIEAGGSAMSMSPPGEASGRRLRILVPATRAELFRRAINGDRIDFPAVPAGTEMQLLDVVVEKP